MPSNRRQFVDEIRTFVEVKVVEDTVQLARRIGLELISRIVKRTPVDTGRARANWQLQFNEVNDAEVFEQDPVSAALSKLSNVGGLGTIYIFNNVPYIEALERGHSKQAPNGMVALSVAEVEAAFP